MAYVTIPDTDIDFKSPMDETLWFQMRDNDEFLYANLNAGGSGGPIQWKINGPLSPLRGRIANDKTKGYKWDGSMLSTAQGWSRVRLALREVGTGGQAKIDIKRHVRANHPISSVVYQFAQTTQSVGRLGTALNTQAISLRTPAISTLTITRTKAQMNVGDIISLGNQKWRLNIDGGVLLDADWMVGKAIVISGATNGTNNKQVNIDSVNEDGHPSIIFTSATGVQELASPAVVNLQMFTYTYTNPVDTSGFVVGENAAFAAHTTGANNGSFAIVRVNDGGNNLIIYNSTAGATTQGGAAGTATCTRWVYTFSSAVLTTDYFVGENLLAASHSNAVNNGSFPIRAINDGGNNLVVTNAAAVAQAGVAGNVNTQRWVYTFTPDPGAGMIVGDLIAGFSHAAGGNNGTFEVKELNRLGLNNFVVYNTAGVVQAAAGAGLVRTEKMIVSFATDQSAAYLLNRSVATIKNCFSSFNNLVYAEVVEINRGGGANYNICVKNPNALLQSTSFEQSFPMGQVDYESRSLFSTLPVLVVSAERASADEPSFGGDAAVFHAGTVPANSIIAVDVLELPTGTPQDLSIDLA